MVALLSLFPEVWRWQGRSRSIERPRAFPQGRRRVSLCNTFTMQLRAGARRMFHGLAPDWIVTRRGISNNSVLERVHRLDLIAARYARL